MSARDAGYQLGYAAFPLVFLAIAAFIGWRMGKKRQPPKFVAWPVGLAALLLVLGMLGNQLRKADSATPLSETR
jgi:MFS family permease